ncbi:hypothetical protein T492DRAFT_881141 [Pavlovales sp. CCMP2436]|nr:hypothetical protein T492DRAFT_881141 [Pavlovales sp. CCMP2436]
MADRAQGAKAAFCKVCATHDPLMVDVLHRRCTGADCEAKPLAQRKFPSFAREGSPATFCKACAAHDPLMVDILHKRCTGADCEAKPMAQRKHPSYAREGAKATFCKACAAHDPLMVDVLNRRCTGADCKAKPLAQRKFPSFARDGKQSVFCQACAAHDPLLVDERPDFFIDVLSHVVILECDENRHARELSECRQQRAWRISDSFGGRPVVFLRFNPDRFVDKQGAVHSSCFALKRGVLTLARETAWVKLLGLVEARLRYHLCTVPDAHLVEEFLFYGDDLRARVAELADVPYMALACPYTAFSRTIKRARAN